MLFSPLRLILFSVAIIFAIAMNIVFIKNGGSPEWMGAVSVVPLLAFAGWTIATDYTRRRHEKNQSHQERLHN